MSTKSSPLSVILVSSGSKGDRLLFRYPFNVDESKEVVQKCRPSNPYALRVEEEDPNDLKLTSSIKQGQLVGYSDKILANILTTKTGLCDRRFELTIDEVKFVGHPTLVQDVNTRWRTEKSSNREGPTMIMFNLVFVLHASADFSLVKCFQDLSKRLSLALKHEERRCGYLSHQAITMLTVCDEVASLPEDIGDSPFQSMLSRSKLCRDLKDVYVGLCERGVAHVHINNWIEVSFCLPHKVHNLDLVSIDPDTMEKSLAAIRPYHAMLLLDEEKDLLNSLPKDCSPSLRRIIKLSSPLKSLQQLSQDADLALSQVFQLVGHMVYWGKATIIFPICGSNVYVLSPHTNTDRFSSLHREFYEAFEKELTKVLADFSLPTPLSEHTEFVQSDQDRCNMVVWLLKKRLLVQLHMYVFLIPTEPGPHQPTTPSDIKESKKGPLNLAVANSPTEGAVHSHGSSGSVLGDNMSVDSDDRSTSLDSYSTMSMDDINVRGHAHSRTKIYETLNDHLTASEKASVLAVPNASNLGDLKLFARLCPYFRGKNHLEEIMYFENVSRSQIRTLLDKFKQVLVACQHQDDATIRYKEFL